MILQWTRARQTALTKVSLAGLLKGNKSKDHTFFSSNGQVTFQLPNVICLRPSESDILAMQTKAIIPRYNYLNKVLLLVQCRGCNVLLAFRWRQKLGNAVEKL